MHLVTKKFSFVLYSGRFLEFMVRNRIHIAVCSASAVWTWSHLTGSKLLLIDLYIVPLMMFCIYQWNRVYDLKEDSINNPTSANHAFINRKRLIKFCLICVFSALTLSIVSGTIQGFLILFLVIILGALYSMPFIPDSGIRLKNMTIVKNLTSALGWTLLVVFYAPVHSGSSLSTEHWFAAIMMFTAVWMVELIWDIRDLRGDAHSEVHTIPLLLGVWAARKWIMIINGSSALILAIGILNEWISSLWLFLLLNHVMIYIWVTGDDSMLGSRERSHLLVGLQTMLLVSLGVLVVYST